MDSTVRSYRSLIIRLHFGEVVETAANVLMNRGRCRLEDVVSFSNPRITRQQALASLQKLDHHNLLKVGPFTDFPHNAKDEKQDERVKKVFEETHDYGEDMFELNEKNVELKAKFPLYIHHIQNKYSNKTGTALLVDEFSTHGRGTPRQLEQLFVTHVEQNAQNLSPDDPMFTFYNAYKNLTTNMLRSRASDAFHKAFKKLRKGRYIIKITDPNKSKNARKRMTELSLQHAPAKKLKGGAGNPVPSSSSSSTSSSSSRGTSKANQTYMINHDRFTLDFRTDAICDYVTRSIDATASNIVRALLQTYGEETLNDNVLSVGSSVIFVKNSAQFVLESGARTAAKSAIAFQNAKTLRQKPCRSFPPAVDSLTLLNCAKKKNRNLTMRILVTYLKEMWHLRIPIFNRIEKIDGNPVRYYINIAGIIGELKVIQAQKLVKMKYGVEGARIFRLIQQKKQLEDKQISDFALLPPKECRRILYKLFQDKFVQKLDVPRSKTDRAPNKLIYLYSVPLKSVFRSILGFSLCQAWSNVQKRFRVELDDMTPILEKREKLQQFPANEEYKISGEEQEKHERWVRAQDRFENALERLEHQIALFRDY